MRGSEWRKLVCKDLAVAVLCLPIIIEQCQTGMSQVGACSFKMQTDARKTEMVKMKNYNPLLYQWFSTYGLQIPGGRGHNVITGGLQKLEDIL